MAVRIRVESFQLCLSLYVRGALRTAPPYHAAERPQTRPQSLPASFEILFAQIFPAVTVALAFRLPATAILSESESNAL
jgi:hypothetical protein